jgi:hypothetical protein
MELQVPRDRKGEFESAWLPERKGQDPELEALLAEAFLAGLSTRDLARISEKYLGRRYDSKQVSRIVARATTELESWRQRRLRGQRSRATTALWVPGGSKVWASVNLVARPKSEAVSREGPRSLACHHTPNMSKALWNFVDSTRLSW